MYKLKNLYISMFFPDFPKPTCTDFYQRHQ